MTKRSIKEIELDIETIKEEIREWNKTNYIKRERRFKFHHDDKYHILLNRLRNLHNELNQAKIKNWWNPRTKK